MKGKEKEGNKTVGEGNGAERVLSQALQLKFFGLWVEKSLRLWVGMDSVMQLSCSELASLRSALGNGG